MTVAKDLQWLKLSHSALLDITEVPESQNGSAKL